MPSPIAHSVSGYIISRLFPPDKKISCQHRQGVVQTLFALFVVMAPDLDFIPQILTGQKYHHGLTHSLTFTIAFTVIVWGLGYFLYNRLSTRLFLLVLILYGSHLFMDYFTQGGPGIQLFWPFSQDYFKSPIAIFPETHHSAKLFHHPGHFIFIVFEVSYAIILLGSVWFWNQAKKKVGVNSCKS